MLNRSPGVISVEAERSEKEKKGGRTSAENIQENEGRSVGANREKWRRALDEKAAPLQRAAPFISSPPRGLSFAFFFLAAFSSSSPFRSLSLPLSLSYFLFVSAAEHFALRDCRTRASLRGDLSPLQKC